MDCISLSSMTKFSSNSSWPEVFSNLWVHWPTELSERFDGILLSDLHDNAWTTGHTLDHTHKLRDNTFVHFEKFFSCWLIEREHLHGGDLKSLLEDHVNHLTCKTLLYNMGLNNAAGAVVESSSGGKRPSEELSSLLLIVSFASRPVDCVSHSIRSKCSSKRVWSNLLGFLGIGWTKNISKFGDSSLRDKFHSSTDITLHVSTEI